MAVAGRTHLMGQGSEPADFGFAVEAAGEDNGVRISP
jgi:hypothetical protein